MYALLHIYMFSPRHFIKFNVFTRVGATPRRHLIPANFRDKDSRPATRPARASVSHKVALLLFLPEHPQKGEDRFKRMEFPCDRGGSVTRVRPTQLVSDATASVCAKHYAGNDSASSATTVSSYGISLELICMRNILCMRYTHIVRSFRISLKIYFQFDMNASYCKIDNRKDSV